MKKLSFAIGLVLSTAAMAAPIAHAADEKPIITFRTNIYDQYGSSNSFHIVLGTSEETYFDIDYGYGTEEVAVGQAIFDEETQAIVGTTVSMSVGPDGIVKIYGDASLLDYFGAIGCYIDRIDLGDCKNLEILDLQHNELSGLDLSPYPNLRAVYLSDNPFSKETPLVVGDNHPELIILEVDITQWISPDFDICHYPKLMVFDGYACQSLTHIDPTKCSDLLRLSLDSTPVRTVDVSKNPRLQVLNVEDSGIGSLDLSNNPELTQLYITHTSPNLHPESKFTGLDISRNPKLAYLAAGGNRLSAIDLSNNPLLTHIFLQDNLLTSIDVEGLDNLYVLDLRDNYFNYNTLPLPNPQWGEYYYAQHGLKVDREYKVGSTIDLSKEVVRPGTVTQASLYSFDRAANESTPLPADYVSYKDGTVTLHKECPDSVFVSFVNSSFMEWPLTTAMFKVRSEADFGKPSPVATIGTTLQAGKPFDIGVGIAGASAADPATFYVDLGDGKQTRFQATGSGIPLAPNVASTVKGDGDIIVYIPSGSELTALSVDDMPLYSLDVAAASNLQELSAANTALTQIDLSLNNRLRSLDLSGNRFTSVDLTGANGALGKTGLRDINLSNNRLSSVVLNDTRAIDRLDLSHNRLATFDYKEFEYLLEFNISHNSLSSVNLSYFTSATKVDVSHNVLEEVLMPETNVFEEFRIDNNRFTLANLPLLSDCDYEYAPQAAIAIPEVAPGVNLSAQNRVVDGVGTTFTWRMADDNSDVPADKIECAGGLTRFTDPDLGTVYCVMTNPAFPAFKGDNALRTTNVTAAAMPTRCIASFTTTEEGQPVGLSLAAAKDNTALYIDWTGEGLAPEQYLLTDTYRLFDATTRKGARVKVLTYEATDTITVFSMSGASLADADFTDMDSVSTLTIANAGLSTLKFPKNYRFIEELNLDGNRFDNSSLNIARFDALRVLNISNNSFDALDLSKNRRLILATAANNALTSVKLDNPQMWMLDLGNNNLTEIDLSGVPDMQQLFLTGNRLSEIDVDGLDDLLVLTLDQNRFKFSTLPLPDGRFKLYNYWNQAALTPPVEDHKCDLSSEAEIDGVATVYQWFVGVPEIDENGALAGEELYVDDEYTIEDGITTFLIQYDGIMCVMTNELFPNLYLYTNLLSTEDGIRSAEADTSVAVTLNGDAIAVTTSGIADGTPVALHSLDGRRLATSAVASGKATLSSVPRGHCVLSVAGKAFKLLVK